ncbi:hypothetical protein KJ865_13035, partial [Myxococcota bacterium]|nr:hypothetical protein [Myxococcota bacterium]
DGFIMTFTLDGTLEETRLYGNSGDNSIYDLAVTPEGNIAATGPSQGGFNDQTAPGGAVDAFYLIVPPSFP